MKKLLSVLLIVVLCMSLAACGYAEEKEAITGTKWYSEADASNAMLIWEFSEETVTQTEMYLDGNGRHESEKRTASYTFEKDVIKVAFEDGECVIPYNFFDGKLILDDGNYLTVEDVEEQLQGHWQLRESSYNPITGFSEHEYHIEFNNGRAIYENAADAYGGAPGEYYYYGPYEGTYEIADGAFLSDESKIQSNIYFVVEDGKVCVCKYDDKLEKGGEFPGEDNYIFN